MCGGGLLLLGLTQSPGRSPRAVHESDSSGHTGSKGWNFSCLKRNKTCYFNFISSGTVNGSEDTHDLSANCSHPFEA